MSDGQEKIVAHKIGPGDHSNLLIYEQKNVRSWIVSTMWCHRDDWV